MTQSDSSSKLGIYPILVVLGVLTTSFLTVLGIWGDEEIHVHARVLRDAAPLDYKDEFNTSLQNAIMNNFGPELCNQPNRFFSNFEIAGSALTPVLESIYWNENLFDLEKEAYRRCEARHIKNTVLSCFLFNPQMVDDIPGFLGSSQVFVELYLHFRDAKTRATVSCQQALTRQETHLTAYYSLYWNQFEDSELVPYRLTGGFREVVRGQLEARIVN
ncbi:hypothetical protein [Pseudobacteriovorax antillogorgiicola]|uniref:Uncharacterized protein n=1 Tax=Pseudobacteriovorax antillogorgiicola TaxID=1513793 RepID=A0A1Y6BVZ2_9BACT|nr:hypothetical protein [Pseudobacteriovorax antillogorgiicola]TCS52320.1 hypothetical protein EDD56_10964 [Pseudobacteriovorax antillogorgiicola]SMF30088.1 hypothetical protein SAMN06296036_109149 [Pseudobacteriovorax antillogorgiicola]